MVNNMQTVEPVHVKAVLRDITSGSTEIRHLLYNPCAGSGYSHLQAKLEEVFHLKNRDLNIFWKDLENDEILIKSDDEVRIALNEIGSDILKLHVHSIPRRDPLIKNAKVLLHSECSNCKCQIKKYLYKCLECLNYNLCEACEKKHSHIEHFTVRISKKVCKELMENFETIYLDLSSLVKEMRLSKHLSSLSSSNSLLSSDCLQQTEIKENKVTPRMNTNGLENEEKSQVEEKQNEGHTKSKKHTEAQESVESSVKLDPVASSTEDLLRSVTHFRAADSGMVQREKDRYESTDSRMEFSLLSTEVGKDVANQINEEEGEKEEGSSVDSSDESWSFVSDVGME